MGKYVVRKLPEELVINKKIEEGTFPEVDYPAHVRPNAVRFANQPKGPNFVIIYCDEFGRGYIDFFLRYEGKHHAPAICRCVGRRAVRKHWENVLTIVDLIKLSFPDNFFEKDEVSIET